jgi:hypothetical protein
VADFEFVDLFHGTSSHYLKDVFEQGLLPGRAREGKWNTGWSARADLVYLTDYGAAYYAVMSAARMPEEWQAKHIPVILKIAIEDTTCLFPDEDFIRECLKHPATPALADLARTEFPELTSTAGINPTEERWRALGITWQDSLTNFGTVTTFRIQPRLINGYHLGTEESLRPFGGEHGPMHPDAGVRKFFRAAFNRALHDLTYQERAPSSPTES